MVADRYLLIELETQGNQRHVFASNRRREMLGASEQILRMTTQELLNLVADLTTPPTFSDRNYASDVAAWINNPAENPPIESGKRDFEVIFATSGKAALLARDRGKAEQLITSLSAIVLRECPGLSLMGAISPAPIALDTAQGFHAARKQVLDRLNDLVGSHPPPVARFARIPFSEVCRSTGGPAEGFDENDPALKKQGRLYPYSAESLARRKYQDIAKKRLTHDFGGKLDLTTEIDSDKQPELQWWGVVHADGNGLGQFFIRFDEFLPAGDQATARDYINALRRFSIALERNTRQAAVEAMEIAWPGAGQGSIDLKPLILAGDDLTLVCEGRRAIVFARAFMERFAALTGADTDLTEMTSRAVDASVLASQNLTAAAGIAVVKPHHPFHRAYELAEGLCASAKACKKLHAPASALDFYIAFDMASDLETIRADLNRNGGPNWGGPYTLEDLPEPPEEHEAKVALRPLSLLRASADLIKDLLDEDQDTAIGRGKLHDLRTALFTNPEAVGFVVRRLEQRPGFAYIREALFGGSDLRDKGYEESTLLLDAMELVAIGAEDGL